MNYEKLINERYQDTETYIPSLETMEALARRLGRPVDEISKLDSNENLFEVLPPVRLSLLSQPYNLYPDPSQLALRTAISKNIGIPLKHIVAGNGCAEMVDYICRLFLNDGEVAMVMRPTYGLFKFSARVAGARVVEVPLEAGFGVNVDWLKESMALHNPKVLFLVCPDNPSGMWHLNEVIIAAMDHDCIVVLDETYVEFSNHHSRVGWVTNHENLVVLRSFSKAVGLAGLRLGYGVFPRWMAKALWSIKMPADVTMAAQAAGVAALENWDMVEDRITAMKMLRTRMYEVLDRCPVLSPVRGSQANYILCQCASHWDSRSMRLALESHGVLVRGYDDTDSGFGMGAYIRITVGDKKAVDHLTRALEKIF